MKKYALGVVSALVASLLVLLPGHAAHGADDPYQDAICSIVLSAPQVVSGESFTVTVTADRPADLSVTFQGETRSRANTQELVATFRAPVVDDPQTLQVTASCDGNPRTVDIQVLPAGVSGDGGTPGQGGSGLTGSGSGTGESALAALLPRTGGAPSWLLLLGVALAVVGGAVVVRRRRA